MGNPFSPEQLDLIVDLLNRRGFVVDEDIPSLPCRYVEFGTIVEGLEEVLRVCGYSGGALSAWSTGFRGATPGYGCVDRTVAPDQKIIDAYCDISNIESVFWEIMTPNSINALMLGLEFVCTACGHESKVPPTQLSPFMRSIPLFRLRGRCTKCGVKGLLPPGVWKTFHEN